ncbi:MAG: ATP-binding protein [Phycisphaerales bacterium]
MTQMQPQTIDGPSVPPLPSPGSGTGPGTLSPTDLAELMTAFTEVTTKLEQTHAQLRGEVSRLSAELRDANEALQRSRRLAALGEMAAGISHEIRNPLGSIRLYANMLHEDLSQLPQQQEIVGKIGRAVRGLDEIVGDVLIFAREMKVQHHACDMAGIIDAALEMCCAEIASRVERIGETIELDCDPTLIQQALINVLRNAGEANRASGGERITISVVPSVLEEDGRRTQAVSVTITDEGDGIPAAVIERMFNPFFTTRATGTGLGLAIVHRIVDAHGGTINVTNRGLRGGTSGSGASVEIILPRSQAVVVTRGRANADAHTNQQHTQRGRLQSAMG